MPKKEDVQVDTKTLTLKEDEITSMQDGLVLLPTIYINIGDDKTEAGTLIDSGSTDNYIRNEFAQDLNLPKRPCKLQTHGINGQISFNDSWVYKLSIHDKDNVEHDTIFAFGLDKIAEPESRLDQPAYEDLCSDLGIDARDVKRPSEIDFLISNRNVELLADRLDKVGKIGIWTGPLGVCLSGYDESKNNACKKSLCIS